MNNKKEKEKMIKLAVKRIYSFNDLDSVDREMVLEKYKYDTLIELENFEQKVVDLLGNYYIKVTNMNLKDDFHIDIEFEPVDLINRILSVRLNNFNDPIDLRISMIYLTETALWNDFDPKTGEIPPLNTFERCLENFISDVRSRINAYFKEKRDILITRNAVGRMMIDKNWYFTSSLNRIDKYLQIAEIKESLYEQVANRPDWCSMVKIVNL